MFKKSIIACSTILFLYLMCMVPWASATVKMPVVFGDNMVLQQKDTVPFWGKCTANKSLSLVTSWNNRKYSTTSDGKGNWKLSVFTPGAGGPYQIELNDGVPLTIKNVLIGEVWICSGQSNMEMPLDGWGKVNNYKQEILAANYPNIRLLQTQRNTSTTPLYEAVAEGGGWQTCDPASVTNFSSTAYFFARNIYEHTHVPIGLIHSSWGGTVAEAWTGASSLKKMTDFGPAVTEMLHTSKDEATLLAQYKDDKNAWENQALAKDSGFAGNWTSAAYKDGSWPTMSLPINWEKAGLEVFNGVVWFRKKISIPAGWEGKELQLSIGKADDDDITWFNGNKIGSTTGWDKPRKYTIPASMVHAGENTIVVRVFDGGGGGGIYGNGNDMFLSASSGDSIPLHGIWKYKSSLNLTDLPPIPSAPDGPNRPTVLFNAMIHPYIPFGIRGVIWYQGESNTARATQYKTLFPLLIADWRTQWGQGDFPFYFVELANHMDRKSLPSESEWAELREAQLKTLSVPNTGMAVAIDIGDAEDIHPKNKQEVGRRLALIAKAKVYGANTAYSGPVFTSMKIEGSKIRLKFDHTNEGLLSKNGTLKGFAIAGADKKFYWAEAQIVGNEIMVFNTEVPVPVAVRYAWADNPDCNLYNGAGLPASPFRTDDWPLTTKDRK